MLEPIRRAKEAAEEPARTLVSSPFDYAVASKSDEQWRQTALTALTALARCGLVNGEPTHLR